MRATGEPESGIGDSPPWSVGTRRSWPISAEIELPDGPPWPAALAGATLLTAVVIADGRSSRLRGLILIAGYVGVAIAFYLAGDR